MPELKAISDCLTDSLASHIACSPSQHSFVRGVASQRTVNPPHHQWLPIPRAVLVPSPSQHHSVLSSPDQMLSVPHIVPVTFDATYSPRDLRCHIFPLLSVSFCPSQVYFDRCCAQTQNDGCRSIPSTAVIVKTDTSRRCHIGGKLS